MLRPVLALAVAPVLALSFLAKASPAPALGPGAVLEMQKQFFAAIDRGDADAARAFVDVGNSDLVFFGLDGGTPVVADGSAKVGDMIGKLARDAKSGGGTWTTTIASWKASCGSADASYAVLELDRAHVVDGKSSVQHLRSTALVHYADGKWKLFHWHVSPAVETATVAKKG